MGFSRQVAPYPPNNSNEDMIVTWMSQFFKITPSDWLAIVVFSVIFVIGLIGNFLVIFVVVRNESMRTITNIFLVNLALADFWVIMFCLPVTVLWDVTLTFWFGTLVCKLISYLQVLSVTISVLSLVCISVERWYAICNPFTFYSTLERTQKLLAMVWIAGLIISLPESVTLEAHKYNWSGYWIFAQHTYNITILAPNFTSIRMSTCRETWGDETTLYYYVTQFLVLFIIPILVIGVLYGHIAYVLWLKSTPPCAEDYVENELTSLNHQLKHSVHSGRARLNSIAIGNTARQKEIEQRRKAAKMLIAVVILFAASYLPVHLKNIINAYDTKILKPYSSWLAYLCHFLIYFNSSINPIIYNFMSERFQGEFRRACCCLSSVDRGQIMSIENATLLARSGFITPNRAAARTRNNSVNSVVLTVHRESPRSSIHLSINQQF